MKLIDSLNQFVDTPELDVVRIVCRDDHGGVLLVQEYDDKNWKLPGGKIQVGETILDAIVREAKEELGIGVTAGMINNYVKATIPDSKNIRHIVAVDITGSTIQPTTEVVKFGYFTLNSLPETKFSHHISTAVEIVEQAH